MIRSIGTILGSRTRPLLACKNATRSWKKQQPTDIIVYFKAITSSRYLIYTTGPYDYFNFSWNPSAYSISDSPPSNSQRNSAIRSIYCTSRTLTELLYLFPVLFSLSGIDYPNQTLVTSSSRQNNLNGRVVCQIVDRKAEGIHSSWYNSCTSQQYCAATASAIPRDRIESILFIGRSDCILMRD